MNQMQKIWPRKFVRQLFPLHRLMKEPGVNSLDILRRLFPQSLTPKCHGKNSLQNSSPADLRIRLLGTLLIFKQVLMNMVKKLKKKH